MAERADAEVSAIHEQQQLESQEHELLLNVDESDGTAAMQQQQLIANDAKDSAAPVDPAAASSYVTAGLSFAVDCLGDEWAPADETAQQREERHMKRAGIIKIMELDNRLCAVRQRHRIITRTFASTNGQILSPDKRRTPSSARSSLFSDKDSALNSFN